MSECWFKEDNVWKIAKLISWTTRWHPDHFQYYFTAVVRRADGYVRYVRAKDILLEEPKEWSKPTLDKKAMDFMASAPSTLKNVMEVKLDTQEITPQSSDAEVEAAYQKMVQREGGDHSQGGECSHNRPYDPTPHYPRFDPRPANKSHRFRPRLVNIQDVWWAVQVHPEAIELFNVDGVYLCQVKWIDGEVQGPVGGIPVDQLREIFKR